MGRTLGKAPNTPEAQARSSKIRGGASLLGLPQKQAGRTGVGEGKRGVDGHSACIAPGNGPGLGALLAQPLFARSGLEKLEGRQNYNSGQIQEGGWNWAAPNAARCSQARNQWP